MGGEGQGVREKDKMREIQNEIARREKRSSKAIWNETVCIYSYVKFAISSPHSSDQASFKILLFLLKREKQKTKKKQIGDLDFVSTPSLLCFLSMLKGNGT